MNFDLARHHVSTHAIVAPCDQIGEIQFHPLVDDDAGLDFILSGLLIRFDASNRPIRCRT